jgi:hypothetical protein
MTVKLATKAIILVALTGCFFMYQETPAQKKPKTKPVEVKPVPPDIAYTVSMSKPSTHCPTRPSCSRGCIANT